MQNLTGFLADHALRIPDQTAVVRSDASRISYAQLDEYVNAACAILNQEGANHGDVIVHMFIDEALALIFMIATARLGATVYSIPEHAPGVQRLNMAISVQARVVLTDSEQQDYSPTIRAIPVSWERLDTSLNLFKPEDAEMDPISPWLINTGSGTTGKPKLIEVYHSIFVERMRIYSAVIKPTTEDRVISLMHLDLPSAKNQLMNALYNGSTVYFYNRIGFDPVLFCAAQEISIIYSTSSHLSQLVHLLQKHEGTFLSSLRAVVPAGSTITDDIRRQFQNSFGEVLYVRYGAAETGPIADALPKEVTEVPGTVGRPIEGVAIEVLDDNGHSLSSGDIGRIRIHSPGVIKAYRNDNIASHRAFRDGWFYPGDLGRFTEDGQLVFCGREDDMMIMDGINIFPIEIEQVLLEHPAVREVVAFPLPHEVFQEVPVCVVTLEPGAETETQTLFQYARERLGIRSPKKVVILESIPRNEQGKLIREELISRTQTPARPTV